MSNMRPVHIRLHSRYEGEDVLQEMQGEAVLKGSVLYVRYEEPQVGPEGGTTRTTLKLGGQSIKIIRHGEVESEQTFELNRKLPWFLPITIHVVCPVHAYTEAGTFHSGIERTRSVELRLLPL